MKTKANKILKITILAILMMIVMIQTSIAATTGVITYDTVKVRKDPRKENTKVYGLVSIGDKVEVLEKSGDWYKITCTYEGKEITGYVRGDLIDVKNPESLKDTNTNKDNDSNNSNSNTNNNANSNTNNNTNTEKPNEANNNNTSNTTEKPTENNNNTTEKPTGNNDNNTTNKPTENNTNNSSEQPSENEENNQNEENNNQTEKPTNTNEQIHNQSETKLTTVKVEQEQKQAGKKINLTKDVNIKILPVVNSTNIGTITAGTEATVVEVVNQWIRIETEELIGWARIES